VDWQCPGTELSSCLHGETVAGSVITPASLGGSGTTLNLWSRNQICYKKFFTVRVERPWPRLSREAVAAPSLAVLKARLDGALSTLLW